MSARILAITCMCGALAAAGAAPAADTEKGRLSFNSHCRTCHSLNEGDNRLGPSLHNIVGAKAAAAEGYGNFSQSLRTSEIVWDEETLDAFIAAPDKVVPGNNMKPYAGIPDEGVRRNIVAYLKSESEG